MGKAKLQAIVVITVMIAWLVAIIVAVVDGNALLGVVTPTVTIVLGWLFTERATA